MGRSSRKCSLPGTGREDSVGALGAALQQAELRGGSSSETAPGMGGVPDLLTISHSSHGFGGDVRGKTTVYLVEQRGGKVLGGAEHRYPRGNGAGKGAEAGAGTNLTVSFVCCCINRSVNAENRREETVTGTSAGCSSNGFSHFWRCEAAWEDV